MTKKQKKPVDKWLTPKRLPKTPPPSLRFSPAAWAKLLFLRDYEDTEVGGFGITASDDLLFVEDVQLVDQVCSWAHVAFDDESVADFFDRQVDAGNRVEQFARLWIHSHPGDCPRPSITDEETFERVFGRSDWAVMFILAREGDSYARLRFSVGPGGELEIPVSIDYSRPFGGCEPEAWEEEYLVHVRPQVAVRALSPASEPAIGPPFDEEPTSDWYDSWANYAQDDETLKGFVS